MREELLNPVTDRRKLSDVTALVRQIYALYDSGADFYDELGQLEVLVGKDVPQYEVDGAMSAILPETLAEDLLVECKPLPMDLGEPEMVELLDRIIKDEGTEFQLGYWMRCLKANTGCEKMYDLIFHPGEYLGRPGVDALPAREILGLALREGRAKAKP